jgi:diphthine synthase
MLYLIGLGLNEKGISLEGVEIVKKCKKIYLESYTVDFPYKIENLEKVIGRKVIKMDRKDVESERLIKESKKEDVCLLIYGCPLFATTHISIIMDCLKNKVKYCILYSASVFDAIAESGLQLYKFGKISSMPRWQKNYEPDSFLEFVEQNNSIKAHSLILVDIALESEKAFEQLEKASEKRCFDLNEVLVCCNLGTENSKFYYGSVKNLKKKIKNITSPYCFIIPGEMHFLEKESLERFEI